MKDNVTDYQNPEVQEILMHQFFKYDPLILACQNTFRKSMARIARIAMAQIVENITDLADICRGYECFAHVELQHVKIELLSQYHRECPIMTNISSFKET